MLPVILFGLVGCSQGLHVTPIYRGFPPGLGDPKKAKLAERVTGSFTHFSATREEKDGTIRVAAVPNPEIIRMLESAEPDARGFGAVGPCLVNDDTTYSYYVLRIYDRTCNLIGYSVAWERPIVCHGGSYDLSAFRRSEIEISFPANAAILREAAELEFSMWFEPLRPTGRVEVGLPPTLRHWGRCAEAGQRQSPD